MLQTMILHHPRCQLPNQSHRSWTNIYNSSHQSMYTNFLWSGFAY